MNQPPRSDKQRFESLAALPVGTGGFKTMLNMWSIVFLFMVSMSVMGCGSYHLAGTVIEGAQPAVLVVDKNDKRLDQPGINSASLMFTIDPDSLNAKRLPMDISDGGGKFSSPVGEPGAGFLEYELFILCRAVGYNSASRKMKLPGGNKRLLIVLSPGTDTYKPKRDILDETIDMGHKLTPSQ